MRIFATRPKAQNMGWAQRLRAAGFDVVEVPLLELIPLPESQQRPIINCVLALDEYQKVVFVSQNAVEHAFAFIQQYWPQLPVGLGWYAVGRKTRARLCGFLEEGQAFFDMPPEALIMDSESLLAQPELADLEGQNVLIFRGVGGRDLIRQSLSARGASVRYCELYTRELPRAATTQLVSAELNENDLIPVFSGESLENLDRILSSGKFGTVEPRLIVPGDRVAELARELDYERVTIAKNASEEEMLRAINTL